MVAQPEDSIRVSAGAHASPHKGGDRQADRDRNQELHRKGFWVPAISGVSRRRRQGLGHAPTLPQGESRRRMRGAPQRPSAQLNSPGDRHPVFAQVAGLVLGVDFASALRESRSGSCNHSLNPRRRRPSARRTWRAGSPWRTGRFSGCSGALSLDPPWPCQGLTGQSRRSPSPGLRLRLVRRAP